MQPLTVTVEQAAQLLGIGCSTPYELVHTGDIPSLRLGRRIVVPARPLPQSPAIGLDDIRALWADGHLTNRGLPLEHDSPSALSRTETPG
jgi:excisionase family DNA binding protein